MATGAALMAAGQAPGRVVGEAATAPDGSAQFSLRDAAGAVWGVQMVEGASVVLVAPGAKDLSEAAPVAMASIRPGDRLLVRGTIDAGVKTVLANSVVVMSQDAVAAARAREQAEWRTKSVAGTVVRVDEAGRRLIFLARGAEAKEWTAAVPESVEILRYAEDSIRFADARRAGLSDVRVGDQVRVLGERDEAAAAVTAARVLAGSFRTLGGEITRVDVETGIVTLRDVQNRETVTLRVNGGANLRRMPGMGGSGGGRPGMAMGMGMGMMRAGGGGPGGEGPRRPDLQQMLDRLPAAALSELKPGDAVIVSAGRTSGPQPWSVVSLVTGADALLRAPAAQVNQTLGNWSMELPMQ
jgi:Cu/Ag efflux protein CusF